MSKNLKIHEIASSLVRNDKKDVVIARSIATKQSKLFIIFYFLFIFSGCAVPQKKTKVTVKPEVPVVSERMKETLIPEAILPQKSQRIVKIGIFENLSQVTIGAEDDFVITDTKTGKETEMSADNAYVVKIIDGKIIFIKKQYQFPIKLNTKNPKYKIKVGGKRYRGNIILRIKNKKRITVINEVGIEDYLCGVMTKEVSPDWAIESLKAQAVVARTFAIKNLNRHYESGFDLCSQTHCQVYGGADSEDERSDNAVADTAGEILVYNGGIINTLYHSSCGGHTEDIRNVWQDSKSPNPEYLTGVECGFCEDDRWYNWTAKYSFAAIANNLRANGYKIKDIKRIKAVGYTSSGRVKEILIEHSKGNLWLASSRFRTSMGSNVIRSTNFKIKLKKNVVYFTGHGWGHGVGMCQWGAKGMAEKGWNYEKILKYYYRNTEIKKLD
ncbi:MAG: SpoIID/LytB domain-containing protein [Elusimicrobia bacterium]|nr:SpoIID/LytB domain-containing protein [Elusimicrobiota bacterium]